MWIFLDSILPKSSRQCNILWRVDNTTALAYVKKEGERPAVCKSWRSQRRFWSRLTRCLSAFFRSSFPQGKTSWQTQRLASKRFQTGSFIPQCSGCSRQDGVSLFASNASKQTQRFFSWDASDNPEAVYALSQKWDFSLEYAFPPIPLLKRVVKKLETSKGTFILVSPLWKAQTWLALLLMLKVLGGSPISVHGQPSDGSDNGKAAPNPSQPSSSRLEDFLRLHSLQDLPSSTRDLHKAGWRPSTESHYERAWQSFKRHLRSSSISLDQVGVTHIMNYLTLLQCRKLSYSTINLHRPAISMTLSNIDGTPIGSHPLVTRLVKGVFTKRPPSHKVPSVWDPAPIMDIFMHWSLPLSRVQLVRKCAFTLTITSARRLSKLFSLKCNGQHIQINNDFVQFVPASLSKTDRVGHLGPPIRLKVHLPGGYHPHPLG
jgi:hypothetical protein